MADPSPACSACGKPTEWACSDCKIDTGESVFICGRPKCLETHDVTCTYNPPKAKHPDLYRWPPPCTFPTHALQKVMHAVIQATMITRKYHGLVYFGGNDRPTVQVEVCQDGKGTWRVELSRTILLAEGLDQTHAEVLATIARSVVAQQDEQMRTSAAEMMHGLELRFASLPGSEADVRLAEAEKEDPHG